MKSRFVKQMDKVYRNFCKIKTRNLDLSSSFSKQCNIPTDYQEFNKMIGYPINRNTGLQQKMTQYQIQYHDAKIKHHKIIVNKSRKIGATEAAIRSIALDVFSGYQGHDIMIIAGNELNIAREILIRFDELFHDKPGQDCAFQDLDGNKWHYDELIRRSSIHGQKPIVEFKNDTRVFCFAASKSGKSQTFRGPDDVICIFFSEAAHTGMLQDQPIMNALEPNLANRDYGDIILESTPNGKRGFFYNYWSDSIEGKDKSWHTLTFDYKLGLKYKILSPKYVSEQKQNLRLDFEQEYRCKFTTPSRAAFREQDMNYLSENEGIQDYRQLVGGESVSNN